MRSWGTGRCRARPRPLRCCRGSALPWHPAGRKDSLMKTPRPGAHRSRHHRNPTDLRAVQVLRERCGSRERIWLGRRSWAASGSGTANRRTGPHAHTSLDVVVWSGAGKALPAIHQPRPLMHLVVETHSGVPSSRSKEEFSSSTILAPAELLGSWPFTDRRYAVRVTTGGGSRRTRLGVRSADLR